MGVLDKDTQYIGKNRFLLVKIHLIFGMAYHL